MNSTVRKTIIFFSIIFIPFIVVITCPFIGYMVYLGFDTLFREIGSSIEKKKGLEGCDTVPLAGDKEQIAEAFMANVDAIWVKVNELDKEIKPQEACDSVNDPLGHYTFLCYSYHMKDSVRSFDGLAIYPSKYYKSYTDLILYDKDKLLCMAFIVLRRDFGYHKISPQFETYVVIGERENINEPFKIFVRDNGVLYGGKSRKIIKYTEEYILYDKGATYKYSDVYPVTDTDSLPVLSDPDFFEKHPLFEKFDDSTYNFEWYKTEGTPEKYYRYDYPY